MAKDLVQETFTKTWAYLAKGAVIENMRAFFYRTLGNLIIDEYRKKKSISLDAMTEYSGFEPVFHDQENLENKIDGRIAIDMLKDISEGYREVIFMRYVEDMTLTEIAAITGESENAIAVKVHRGLKKMKELFNEKQNKKL